MPTLSGSSLRRSCPLTLTLNRTQFGDFDFKILVTLFGTPEGTALCNGTTCGLWGQQQLRVVVLMHVRVQQRGYGHGDTDLRVALGS